MQDLSVSKILKHDITTVWKAISDVGAVHKFHPLVQSSPLLSQQETGLECTRRCDFYDGTSIVEKVIDFEPEKTIKFELSEMNMPMTHAFARMTVIRVDNDTTEFEIKMTYEMKYGLLGKIMGVMMKPMMKGMFKKVINGLDDHLNTGQIVAKDGKFITD